MTTRSMLLVALVCGVLPPVSGTLLAVPPGTPSIPTPGGGGYRPSTPRYTRPSTPRYTRPTTPRYTRPTTPGYTRPTTPSHTPRPGVRRPGQPYQPKPGQSWQMPPTPGLRPHQRKQTPQPGQPGWSPSTGLRPHQAQSPGQQYGANNPYSPNTAYKPSQPSVPFSERWFAPQRPSHKPLYHEKGKPRFKWRIHPDLRVLIVLAPAIVIMLLIMRPVIWKYISALRQIRKERREFLASIRKWRKELSKGYVASSDADRTDSTRWDELIQSLKSSRASTRTSARLRKLAARTTAAYIAIMGGYLALICVLACGLWQLSPYSTILPNRFMDSIPCLIAMIVLIAFSAGWLAMLLYPFVIRGMDGSVSIPLEKKRAPELRKLITAAAEHFHAPVPHEIHLSALPTACVSRRRRFLRRRWRLTLGLPFLGLISPRQLLAMLAHELEHTKQNRHLDVSSRTDGTGNMFIESVNRLAWIRSLPSTPFGAFCETLILTPIFLLFKAMAYASIYLSRKLSRELEFHADRQTACVLSPEEHKQFMAMLGRSQLAMQLTFQELGEIYNLKILPDNLPELIRHNDRNMPAQAPTALRKHMSKQKTLWFDTHPTDAERTEAIGAIKPYPQPSLAADFDQLDTAWLIPDIQSVEVLTSIAHYRESVGEDYKPEMLKPTGEIIDRFKSRFDAMIALNRLLGRYPIPQAPIEITDTPHLPPEAAFEQCAEQIQAYRQWRIEHTEELAKSTETLQTMSLEAARLYFVELVNVAVPSMHAIVNEHLRMTDKRAIQAVTTRKQALSVFDLYDEQHKRLDAYFQAVTQLFACHEQRLNIPDLQTLREQHTQNLSFAKGIQKILTLLSSIRIKFGLLPELIQFVHSCKPPETLPPNTIMSEKLRTAYDFIGFVNGRVTRMLCIMGQTARAVLELKHMPSIAEMGPRLEKIALLSFNTLDDYQGDALDDAAWMLQCLEGIHRSVLSKLAYVSLQVEEALGMDVSSDNFASEQMQEQLAFHIV
jgi:Zn-dependent protease with chaperone function